MEGSLFSLDRYEDSWAVLVDEEGNSLPVPRTSIVGEASPGMMVRQCGEHYEPDEVATAARREQVLRLQRRLRDKQF